MFKVRCDKNWDNDVWHLVVGKIYNCELMEDIYVVHELVVVGNNSSILRLTYGEDDFNKRFTDIQKERKLKLEKINESNL